MSELGGGEGNTYKDKFFRSVLKKGFLKTKSDVLLEKKNSYIIFILHISPILVLKV